MGSTPIDATLANQVLFMFGRGGYAPGGFREKLLALISSADPENENRLALAFPGEVIAVQIAEHVPGGTAYLARIAAGEDVPEPERRRIAADLRERAPVSAGILTGHARGWLERL